MTDGTRLHAESCNAKLAQAIRKVEALHEGSWDAEAGKRVSPISGELRVYGEYTKRYSECIKEVVGDDPIAKILACLFTAGYSEMYEFADEVLGKEQANEGQA